MASSLLAIKLLPLGGGQYWWSMTTSSLISWPLFIRAAGWAFGAVVVGIVRGYPTAIQDAMAMLQHLRGGTASELPSLVVFLVLIGVAFYFTPPTSTVQGEK
ncbi:MAG: hypothetical protein HYT90_00495 [Candidatus Omnitrophica bacterium]|nr:hypothetical protein [Candidatus Omnitrophota bacterium]